ncbi:MAG: AAA family ATPase [Clostridiales bacterium]|nr:AAA family ATPase [Clostridiales bacterium]
MGLYLNPGNAGFRTITNGIYIDKTGLIDYMNSTLDTYRKLTCFSRPRRFGKSFAAKMLCAYYDKSCNSRELFNGLEIAGLPSFEKGLNRYDVIYLDMTAFISRSLYKGKDVIRDMQIAVIEELNKSFKNCIAEGESYLPDALFSVCRETGHKFIIIIDEWDALFREAKDDESSQKEYVQLLRGLFKGGTVTDNTIAAAYMTGILPIKKYGTESALTDFQEYTMTSPDELTPYVGFTESEVRRLCAENIMNFDDMKCWYDGYSFRSMASVYSPNSVMSAIQRRRIRSYWTSSETYESLKGYITQNFDGLKDAVVLMLGGMHVAVDIASFQNDLTSLESRDDVLTLLIHLGYLAYDEVESEVYIPNLEVSEAFKTAVKRTGWTAVSEAHLKEVRDRTAREDYVREEGLQEGIRQGIDQGIRQGIDQGAEQKLLSQIERKLAAGQTEEQIAEDLLEPLDHIRELRKKIK